MGYIQVGTETLDQNVDAGTGNDYFGYSGRNYMSMSFTTSVSGMCTKLSADLKIGAGSPTGNISCYLYSDNAGEPGTLLSTLSTLDSATLTGSYVFYDFTKSFATAYEMLASTKYHLVLHKTVDNSNYPHWNSGTNTYASGNTCYGSDAVSWTSQATSDNDFKQYYTGFRIAGGSFLFNLI